MRNIKKYEDFTNEEINLKKALTGAALGAGLAFSTPSISQTQDSILQKRVDSTSISLKDGYKISKDKINEFWFKKDVGKWNKYSTKFNIESKVSIVNNTKYLLISTGTGFGENWYIADMDSISKKISNVKYNSVFDINFDVIKIKVGSTEDEFKENILKHLKWGNYTGVYHQKENKSMRCIVGYNDGIKVIRFKLSDLDDFSENYFESEFSEFSKLFKQ